MDPLPPGSTLATRVDSRVQTTTQRLRDLYTRDDKKHRKCGEEIGYPSTWDADQLPTDTPLVSEQKERRWRVLAGDYLADKGFRIHNLLSELNAGIFKPPTRFRGQKQNTADEVIVTMGVANMRIHVERDMRRARECHLMNQVTPIHRLDLISDEVYLAFMLFGNFQAPLEGLDFHT